uniref:Uncharacterized protein n=1 Tax=Coturnix japonica TaxID=93934 RepID=A0A8C2UEN3_COTJA
LNFKAKPANRCCQTPPATMEPNRGKPLILPPKSSHHLLPPKSIQLILPPKSSTPILPPKCHHLLLPPKSIHRILPPKCSHHLLPPKYIQGSTPGHGATDGASQEPCREGQSPPYPC